MSRRTIASGLLLVVLIAVAYAPVTQAGFVFDDRIYVTDNAWLDDLAGLEAIWAGGDGGAYTHQYYPITSSLFWVQKQLWGLDPLGYHVVNVLFHTLNAILLWGLLRRLRVPGAWLAGAIFGLHPVHVQSVAWISELKNVLSTAFFLSAAHALLRPLRLIGDEEDRSRGPSYAGGLALFGAALLSKTASAVLPVGLLGLIWWKRSRVTRGDLRRLAPLFVMGLAMTVTTILIETNHAAAGMSADETFLQRVLISSRALWFYASSLLWPVELIFIPRRWSVESIGVAWLVWPALLAAVGAVLWRCRERWGRGPLVAVGFFAVAVAPISLVTVAFSRFSFVADHWQYWASMGLISLAAALLTTATTRLRWPVASFALSAGLLCALAAGTWARSHVFRDRLTLWEHTLAHNPSAWIAHTNYGDALAADGRYGEAVQHLSTSVALEPEQPLAHYDLGLALWNIGHPAGALHHLNEAVRQAPGFVKARVKLADVLRFSGDLEGAERHYRHALRSRGDDAEARAGLAAVRRRKRTAAVVDTAGMTVP